jgi:hypothetical protein
MPVIMPVTTSYQAVAVQLICSVVPMTSTKKKSALRSTSSISRVEIIKNFGELLTVVSVYSDAVIRLVNPSHSISFSVSRYTSSLLVVVVVMAK